MGSGLSTAAHKYINMSFPASMFEPPPPIPREIFEYLNIMNAKMDMLTWAHPFGGIKITVDPYLPTERLEQFRFPRSKKSRMRKKWRKDPKNWRTVDARGDIYLLGARKDTALIHPDGFKNLEKRFGVIKNSEVK